MIVQSHRLRYLIAFFLVLTSAVLWGFTGIFARFLYSRDLNFYDITAFRIFITFLLSGLLRFKKMKLPSFTRKNCVLVFILGFSIAGFMLCYFFTMQLTTIAVSVILLYTAPIFVAILSTIIFKEKLRIIVVLAVVLAFAGCFLASGLIGQNNTFNLLGFVLGIASGIGYACYSIISKCLIRNRWKDIDIVFFGFLIASLILSPFLVAAFSKIFLDAKVLLMSLGIGVLCGFLPYLLYTKALHALSGTTANIIVTIEPVFAALLSLLFYGEVLSIFSMIGFVLILASILAILFSNKRKSGNEE